MELTPVSVKALDGYKIWIKFNEGAEGELDLARFAEQTWFRPWEDRGVFESVRIIPYEAVVWGDDDETDMGLCGDALYLELTRKSWEEVAGDAERQDLNPVVRMLYHTSIDTGSESGQHDGSQTGNLMTLLQLDWKL